MFLPAITIPEASALRPAPLEEHLPADEFTGG
jgi:hypothetical protein